MNIYRFAKYVWCWDIISGEKPYAYIKADTEEEAVKISNDTAYGLTNYFQTNNTEKAKRIARKLRSGMVEINGVSFADGSPFGGYKQSGNGREGGKWGIEEFLEVKSISGWEYVLRENNKL